MYRGAHDNSRLNILVRLWRRDPLGLSKLSLLIVSIERLDDLSIARKR